MVLEIETAPASIYAATTAMNAALDTADAVRHRPQPVVRDEARRARGASLVAEHRVEVLAARRQE